MTLLIKYAIFKENELRISMITKWRSVHWKVAISIEKILNPTNLK